MKKTLPTLIVLALCIIVEQIACVCIAGAAGYTKLQRHTRCRQENKTWQETTLKQEFWKHCVDLLTMHYTQPQLVHQVISLYKTHIPQPLLLDEQTAKNDIKHAKKRNFWVRTRAYFEPYFAKYYEFASLFRDIQ